MESVDKDGWRSYQVKDTYFTVPPRYQLDTVIGSGEYGTVCKASTKDDSGETVEVAIKKIAVPCSGTDQLPELRRVVREVVLLQRLSHPNVISLLDIFTAPTVTTERNTTDIYLVTELLDVDLTKLLEMHSALEMSYVQYFGYQLLDAIAYLHACGVVHRDLKPSNVVVNGECDLRVVDFGLARDLDGGDMTEYVVTRYYRAPELLLETRAYSPAIDVWSIGCVLFEMAAGVPLFDGKDIRNQLEKILTVVRKPGAETLKKITSVRAREFMEKQPEREVRSLRELIRAERERKGKSCEFLEEFCTLLDRMIVFDPEHRITAAEALGHGFWKCGEEGGGGGGSEGAEHADPADATQPERIDPQIETKGVEELEELLHSVIDSFRSKRTALMEG